MKWNEMYLMTNIVKIVGNICELLYYKISLVGMKFATFWNDYKSNVRKVIEPRYIVDESHKYSSSTHNYEALHNTSIPIDYEEYTNPIIQKEKGFI